MEEEKESKTLLCCYPVLRKQRPKLCKMDDLRRLRRLINQIHAANHGATVRFRNEKEDACPWRSPRIQLLPFLGCCRRSLFF